MKNLGYYNGKYDELENMSIPMNDRSHWFGDGVYDAGPSRNYHIFALDDHIERFFNSAALLDINMPVTKQEMKDLLNDLVKKVDTGNLFVYYQVTRGTGIRNHVFTEGKGNLWVMLIPSVMAAEKAKKAGCHEAILYRPGGRVTECAHSNCHIIKDGKLFTAPTDELILPGIARAHLIRKCKELGIAVSETPYYLNDLMNAEEVLVTSSSNLCVRVDHIDGKPVGGKQPELFEKMRKAVLDEFMEATK